jgi:uncharacterized membrane protein YhiD involved in acid resistance
MLVSKYGFMDILANGRIVLDPSRVAAQVVSGIGFIGGDIIFKAKLPLQAHQRRQEESQREFRELQPPLSCQIQKPGHASNP